MVLLDIYVLLRKREKKVLKKGKYKFLRRDFIKFKNLYYVYKPELDHLIKKYHILNNGDSMLFVNSPIYDFAVKYVTDSLSFASDFENYVFVLYSMERYSCYDKSYAHQLSRRMMNIVDSIRKNGYACGKFKNKLVCVCVRESGGYEVISGKHRLAACLALGTKKVMCNIYTKEIK